MFGSKQFGGGEGATGYGKRIVLLGDPSSHGGTVTVSGQTDHKLFVGAVEVAVVGAQHVCAIYAHSLLGPSDITPVTIRSFHNGKLIITTGAVAVKCGAIMQPIDRKVYVE